MSVSCNFFVFPPDTEDNVAIQCRELDENESKRAVSLSIDTCEDSKYLSNGMCCDEGEYYDEATSMDYECTPIVDSNNCLKYDN